MVRRRPAAIRRLLVNGRKALIRTPGTAVANIGYLSEYRKRFGLATGMDVEYFQRRDVELNQILP